MAPSSVNKVLFLNVAIIFWAVPLLLFAQNSPFKAPVELNDGHATNIIDVKHIDLDGDGNKDLVTANSNEIRWFKGKGNGKFEASRSIDVITDVSPQNTIIALDVGDLDEDGDMDIVYGAQLPKYALFNDGEMNFQKFSTYDGGIRNLPMHIEILEDSTESGIKVIESDYGNIVFTRYSHNSRNVIQSLYTSIYGSHLREDLDGKHELDLVIVDHQSVKLIFNPFSNKSEVTFDYDPVYYRDYETSDFVIFDANDDGFKDVVLTNKLTETSYSRYSRESYEGNLIYLKNDSNKTFKEMHIIDQVDLGYSTILSTDVNGDSKEDLMALSATNGFKTGNLVSLINLGDGNFSGPEALFEENIFIDNMYQFDIDNDGVDDLVVSSQKGDFIGWYKKLKSGYGEFTEIGSSFIPSPKDVKTLDVDRDGLEDLIVSTGNPNKALLWHRNKGNFEFEDGRTIENNQQFAGTIELGDLDGDGWEDVVMLSEIQAKRPNYDMESRFTTIARDLYWYKNLTNGSFSEKKLITQDTSYYGQLSLLDIDRDGDPDIQLISNRSSVLFLNDGNGTFTESDIELPPGYASTTGDINGDSFDELITVEAKDSLDESGIVPQYDYYNEYSIFSKDSTHLFSKNEYYDFVNELSAYDLDGDSSEEIIISTRYYEYYHRPRRKLEAISYNYDQQTVTSTILDSSETGFHSFAVNDFDHDGDLDIVSTEIAFTFVYDLPFQGGATYLYINEEGMNFTKSQQLDSLSLGTTNTLITQGIFMISSEMNGDEFPEVIAHSLNKEWVRLYPNTVGQQVSTESDFGVPQSISLSQNYPNPFNPSTMINYSIPSAGKVELKVYNLLGQLVQTLVDDRKTSGMHQIRFDASAFASGVYIYQLKAAGKVQTKKMILIK